MLIIEDVYIQERVNVSFSDFLKNTLSSTHRHAELRREEKIENEKFS